MSEGMESVFAVVSTHTTLTNTTKWQFWAHHLEDSFIDSNSAWVHRMVETGHSSIDVSRVLGEATHTREGAMDYLVLGGSVIGEDVKSQWFGSFIDEVDRFIHRVNRKNRKNRTEDFLN